MQMPGPSHCGPLLTPETGRFLPAEHCATRKLRQIRMVSFMRLYHQLGNLRGSVLSQTQPLPLYSIGLFLRQQAGCPGLDNCSGHHLTRYAAATSMILVYCCWGSQLALLPGPASWLAAASYAAALTVVANTMLASAGRCSPHLRYIEAHLRSAPQQRQCD